VTSLDDVTYHQPRHDVNLPGGPSHNDVHLGAQPGGLAPADNGTLCRGNARNGGYGSSGGARTVPPPPPPPRACYRLLQSQGRRLSTGGGRSVATPGEQNVDRTPIRKQSLGGVTNSVDRAIWAAACKIQRKELQMEVHQPLERTNRQNGLYDYQLLLPLKLNEQHRQQQQQQQHIDT